MSRVSITREKLDELALQVSGKSGEPLPLTIDDMTDAVAGIPYPPSLQSKSTEPTETAQTITADLGYDGLSSVDVGAIRSTYVGSDIKRRVGSDLTVNGRMVTVPYGYYSTTVSRLVAAGTAGTPTATKGTVSNHSVTVTPKVTNTTGYITGSTKTGTAVTVTASELESGTKSIAANGTGIDVTGYASVDVAVPSSQPSLQAKSATPTTSQQTITADSGYDGLSSVTVGAAPLYELTVTGGGTYEPQMFLSYGFGNVNVASGTAGTPTATKGTVSNHAVSVTPSVTNTAGYITGGTKNGTAVTVSASELVSGTLSITSSGTKDVTNYASASVAAGGATASATKGTVSNHSVTVTPSVTRTAGYVTAGTSNGTAVTVSASELVSGSETKTANGTYDVTNLASVTVDIDFVTYYTSSSNPTSSQGSNGDIWLVTS